MKKRIEKVLSKYRKFDSDRMYVADALEESEALNAEMADILHTIIICDKLKES